MGKPGGPVEARLVAEHDMAEPAVINLSPEGISRFLLPQADEAAGCPIDESRAQHLAEPVAVSPGKRFCLPHTGRKPAHVARNAAVHDQRILGAEPVERHGCIQEGAPGLGQLRCQRGQLRRLGSLLGRNAAARQGFAGSAGAGPHGCRRPA